MSVWVLKSEFCYRLNPIDCSSPAPQFLGRSRSLRQDRSKEPLQAGPTRNPHSCPSFASQHSSVSRCSPCKHSVSVVLYTVEWRLSRMSPNTGLFLEKLFELHLKWGLCWTDKTLSMPWRGGIAPDILNPGAWFRWTVSFSLRLL
jgi:hypothetical protein